MVNARTARAEDFDRAAQQHANSFWMWIAVGGLMWWIASWTWTILPGAFAIFAAIRSVSATIYARKMRLGVYPIFNPNNAEDNND